MELHFQKDYYVMSFHVFILGSLFCKVFVIILLRHDEGDFRHFTMDSNKNNQETKSYGSIFDYDP